MAARQNRFRHTVVYSLIALISGGLSVVARAQDAGQPNAFAKESPYRLVVDQLSGDVELQDTRGKRIERWLTGSRSISAALAAVPHTRPLAIELINANPLLYRYEVASVSAARGGVKSCTGLGERLGAAGALAALVTMPGQAQPGAAPAREMFLPPPAPPPSRGEGTSRISREGMEAVAEQLKTQSSRYFSTLKTITDLSGTVGDSLAAIAELGESLPLTQLLEDLEKSIARSLPGVHKPADVQLVVRQTPSPMIADAGRYAAAIRSGLYDGDSTDDAAAEILGFTARITQAMREAIPAARILQNQLTRIDIAKQNTRQVFILEPSGDYRRIVIQAIPTTEFADVPRLRAGKRELFSKPVSTFLCEVSVGMAFMNAPPRYAVENGMLVDRDASEERTAPQFLAHVAFHRIPWVAALGGLGFGGQARPDFYLGGTVRVLSPVLFNFGAIWQRTDRLLDGMKVGNPVSDASVLSDLPRRYKAGFFWGFSFGR